MKKSIFMILLISFVLTMTSCSTGENHVADNTAGLTVNEPTTPKPEGETPQPQLTLISPAINANYEIIEQAYTEKKITIQYPQITGLSDKNKQDIINGMLKQKALSFGYGHDDLMQKIQYEIKLQSANVLSVVFTGYNQFDYMPHPMNCYASINIDVNKAREINQKDLVKIDSNFAEKIKHGKFIRNLEVNSREIITENFTDDELIHALNDSHLYLTKDSLGISLIRRSPERHYLEFEVKYQDIINNINYSNEVAGYPTVI